jgi:hypothetical protein
MVLFRLLIEVGGEVSYDRIEVLLIRNRKQIGVYVVFGAFVDVHGERHTMWPVG